MMTKKKSTSRRASSFDGSLGSLIRWNPKMVLMMEVRERLKTSIWPLAGGSMRSVENPQTSIIPSRISTLLPLTGPVYSNSVLSGAGQPTYCELGTGDEEDSGGRRGGSL